MHKLRVKCSKDYDVLIGSGILKDVGILIKERFSFDKLMVIVDENVYRLYHALLAKSLNNANIEFETYIMPCGEGSKSLSQYSVIINKMIENCFSRNSAVVSFGGGVAGDLAGFVSSTYMRGISLIHIPTTLLSQCDSAVGGKTALDTPDAKNVIGTIWQPELVICDVLLLKSLSEDIYIDGMGEIFKYAVLKDENLLKVKNEEEMVFHSLKIKAEYVGADEFDNANRRMLNLGHTVAHAFETLSSYTISHGHAVAMGIEVMSRASYEKGLCDCDFVKKVLDYINNLGFSHPPKYDLQSVFDIVIHDKKRRDKKISLVIPLNFGNCIIKEMDFNDACEFLKGGLI